MPGATYNTEATGINDAGEIVGSYIDGSGNQHGFVTTIGPTSTLQLSGGATIGAGTVVSVGSFDTLAIEGTGATLDGVTVSNAGAIVVDLGPQMTDLVLDGGTAVAGGTIAIGNTGEVEIGAGGATLSGVGVSNANEITVDNGATLDLTDTVIWGGTLAHTGNGVIVVSGTGNVSTLDGSGFEPRLTGGVSALAVDNEGAITVNNSAMLLLAGTINNTGTIDADSGAELGTQGTVALSGGGTISLGGSLNSIADDFGAAVLNTDNTIVGAGEIGSGDGVFAVDSSGVVDATGVLLIDTGYSNDPYIPDGFTNTGLLEATGGGNLEIEATNVTNTGALIAVDGSSTLTLEDSSTSLAGHSITQVKSLSVALMTLSQARTGSRVSALAPTALPTAAR